MAKFVIIDDATIIRMRLKKIIEEFGHEVVGEASNGKEGLKVCSETKYDAITLDISMPELNGIQTLEELLKVNKIAKVLIVSAVGQKQMIIKALELGAKDFIIKPFEASQIGQAINKLLS